MSSNLPKTIFITGATSGFGKATAKLFNEKGWQTIITGRRADRLEELAEELEGKITIGKIDVDSNRDSAAKQNVMSIPTLILFKDGNPVDQRVGALTKNQLKDFINEHI